jgi:hypothetical protein
MGELDRSDLLIEGISEESVFKALQLMKAPAGDGQQLPTSSSTHEGARRGLPMEGA